MESFEAYLKTAQKEDDTRAQARAHGGLARAAAAMGDLAGTRREHERQLRLSEGTDSGLGLHGARVSRERARERQKATARTGLPKPIRAL